MDNDKPGSDSAVAAVESAWQLVASNLQLLTMLEVVREWDRSDAVSVGESAEQTEQLTAAVASAPPPADPEDLERVVRTLDAVAKRAERLARVAPGQARDDACADAIANALQRLAAASATLRRVLASVGRGAGRAA